MRAGMRKTPCSSVTVSKLIPEASWTAVTVTPGSTPPVGAAHRAVPLPVPPRVHEDPEPPADAHDGIDRQRCRGSRQARTQPAFTSREVRRQTRAVDLEPR